MDYVTLKDIAKETGVSTTTVSRALNNKDDISAPTKERIIRIIKERGYTSNAVARGLKIKRTESIGVVIADISDSFFAPIVKEIEKAARQEGYHLILCDTDEDYETEREALKTLIEKRVDGLLITPTQTSFQDIAVVGYDDIDVAFFLEVPLTTVRIPKYELGVEGFKLLKKKMEGEVNSPEKVILPTELVVVRKTCKNCLPCP